MGQTRVGTDVLVIGGGPAGYVAAQRAGQLGLTVTLVEAGELGGTCLNAGCIPSKALIGVGDLLYRVKEAGQRGIRISGSLDLDFAQVQRWKENQVIKRLRTGVAGLLKAADVEVVRGRAHFADPHTAHVETADGQRSEYAFKYAIVATGSQPVNPAFFPVDGGDVVDSTGALAFTAVPRSLAVVGGGYIGVELGIAYAKLGARVAIVEATEQLLPGTDPDLIAVLMRKLHRLGVTVMLKARAEDGLQDGQVKVTDAQGRTQQIPAEKVLVSVGRRPYTEGLDLDRAGVALDERGFIPVDSQQRTNVAHIFAAGDVCSPVMLAHKASAQGRVAAEAIAGLASHADWQTVPTVVFTDPEIASVGLSEQEARARGYDVLIGRCMFAAVGRSLTMGESDGLVKLVADRQTGLLLGAQICGPEASELIGELALALEMGALVEDVALTPHYHPTLSEGLQEAARSILTSMEKTGRKE